MRDLSVEGDSTGLQAIFDPLVVQDQCSGAGVPGRGVERTWGVPENLLLLVPTPSVERERR